MNIDVHHCGVYADMILQSVLFRSPQLNSVLSLHRYPVIVCGLRPDSLLLRPVLCLRHHHLLRPCLRDLARNRTTRCLCMPNGRRQRRHLAMTHHYQSGRLHHRRLYLETCHLALSNRHLRITSVHPTSTVNQARPLQTDGQAVRRRPYQGPFRTVP